MSCSRLIVPSRISLPNNIISSSAISPPTLFPNFHKPFTNLWLPVIKAISPTPLPPKAAFIALALGNVPSLAVVTPSIAAVPHTIPSICSRDKSPTASIFFNSAICSAYSSGSIESFKALRSTMSSLACSAILLAVLNCCLFWPPAPKPKTVPTDASTATGGIPKELSATAATTLAVCLDMLLPIYEPVSPNSQASSYPRSIAKLSLSACKASNPSIAAPLPKAAGIPSAICSNPPKTSSPIKVSVSISLLEIPATLA